MDYDLVNLPYESGICDDFLLLKCRSQHEDSWSSNSLKSEVILEGKGKKSPNLFFPHILLAEDGRVHETLYGKWEINRKYFFLTGLMYAQQLPVTTEPIPPHASGYYEIDL